MRPILKPGLRRLWRDGSTLQIGVDPVRAIVLGGLTARDASVLDALDGTRSREQVLNSLDATHRELVLLLENTGMLEDAASADHSPLSMLDHERLLPDLASISLGSTDPAHVHRILRARRHARIQVRGAGRVGSQVATLLAAAGIGCVVVDDTGVTRPADVAPGGARLDDVGRPRSTATASAIARVARPLASHGRRQRACEPFRPDLVVITPAGVPVLHPHESIELERVGIPHLLAGIRETTAVIGPLVLPGVTSCLHCQHLHRRAAEPAWPLLALQLSRRPDSGIDACDVTLAAVAAGITAMQALTMVEYDGRNARHDRRRNDARTRAWGQPHPPTSGDLPTINGTLEMAAAELRVRRRSWPVHPSCPCRSARLRTETNRDEVTKQPTGRRTGADRPDRPAATSSPT
ncbi:MULTISPECIES: ThiF family adenylyltransferase [unclassified Frankia]|uniref:ThiF family adenylyltransferase n=1 Tax=unclassified Frankia TaxID=2632575 RepID=UPI001EF64950|nr:MULTISPECIES: ThiF family adenylyltransferase [unclassified Frankia]